MYNAKVYMKQGGDELVVKAGGKITIEPDGELAIDASAIVNSPVVIAIESQSLVFSDFTDNTNTTGYIDITTQIPAGSIVLGWKAVTSVGFTGDTTAVIQVGVSGAVDKYSAVTSGSVVAAGTVGSTVKAGNVFEAAAATARVTVTGGADFTSITAGTMVGTLYVVKTA